MIILILIQDGRNHFHHGYFTYYILLNPSIKS